MRNLRVRKSLFMAGALVALVALVSCGGDVSQEDLDAVQDDLSSAEAQVASLQSQLASTAAVTIIQTGQLIPAPAGAEPSGWDTAESIRGGLHLVATYDSSGPDAWSVVDHPLVYYSSEGTESSNPDYDSSAPYFAGFHIIDAYTKEVVASWLINEGIDPVTSFPHNAEFSPDGKWAYVGWRETSADGVRSGYMGIVNVRTLKLDKLLKQESYFEGGMRSQGLHHVQSFVDFEGNDRVITQWGFGANGGPHFILDPNDDNRVVQAITYDDVKPMGHPFTTPDPTGQYIYISVGSNWIRSSEAPVAGIAKYDLATGEHEIIEGVGHHPIGIAHTADGRWTYVVDGHGSHVYKIDNETNEVVGSTSAGVAGPYGLAFNWDETLLYVVGKGEGSHNLGSGLGIIDTVRFRQARIVRQMPIRLGGSASSIDHAILHPDPDVNEMWISNMNGWETIVLDLNTNEVKAYIPTPNGGNTHSGGFIRYDSSWNGELLVDMGGPKSDSMWAMIKTRVAAAAAS